MNKKHFKIRLIFEGAQSMISSLLVGKKVKAFGKDSKGYWGNSDSSEEYIITKVEVNYDVEENYGDVNIFLTDYYAGRYGLIYTDKKFEEDIHKLIKDSGLRLEYSEQGMQGGNYVNMDLEIDE